MSAGLQVWNEGDLFQIDGTYSNMQLRSSQSADAIYTSVYIGSNPQGSYTGILPIATFNVRASSPVFALYSPGNPSVIKSTQTDNAGNWTVQVLCAFVGQVVTLLSFDTATPTASNFGLQVFNESGVLVFDANSAPLLISGAYSGNIANLDPNAYVYNSTVTRPTNIIFPTDPAHKFAVVGAMGPLLAYSGGVVGNGNLTTYLYPGMFQTDPGQIQMPICGFGQTPGPVQAFVQYDTTPFTATNQTTAYGSCFNYQFLVADVTGIV
ncbi:hypothetical protein LMG28138_03881 [Pararobbsia alpina]|uniref:Uncharacterized protein n=1 Tax=Pararobbsia alpina TaxID=621374 RepID=A0A6S7BPS8_9BURK|nr:hypothetical protein LMG28138_03881 [Pararobbsia alpina]